MVIITSRGIAITIDGTNRQTEKTATGSAMIAPAGGHCDTSSSHPPT